MNSTYGKQGPPLYSSARLKQLCHSWPSSPQILQRRHFQNSDFFSIWIWMRSMHSQFLFLILGFAFVVFLFSSKAVCTICFLHHICGLDPEIATFPYQTVLLTHATPLCDSQASHHTDTPEAEMVIQYANNCGRGRKICFPHGFLWKKKKNSGFLNSAFLSGNRCLSLWDSLVFCGCVGEGLPWSWVVLFEEKWEGQAVGVIF